VVPVSEFERQMDGSLPSAVEDVCESSAGAVKAIAALGLATRDPAWVENPATGDRLFVDASGEVSGRVASRVRHDAASSIEGLVAAVEANSETAAEFYIGDKSVVAVCDADGECAHRVVLPLVEDQRWSEIPALLSVSQKDLARSLRTTFRESHHPADLLEIIRAVTFRAQSESGGEVGRGKESVKGSVVREVTAAAALPTTVLLRTCVYECLAVADWDGVELICTLETDLVAELFEIEPVTGVVAAARAAAQSEVANRIRAAWLSKGAAGQRMVVIPGVTPDLHG
jgi:hypothetical protein